MSWSRSASVRNSEPNAPEFSSRRGGASQQILCDAPQVAWSARPDRLSAREENARTWEGGARRWPASGAPARAARAVPSLNLCHHVRLGWAQTVVHCARAGAHARHPAPSARGKTGPGMRPGAVRGRVDVLQGSVGPQSCPLIHSDLPLPPESRCCAGVAQHLDPRPQSNNKTGARWPVPARAGRCGGLRVVSKRNTLPAASPQLRSHAGRPATARLTPLSSKRGMRAPWCAVFADRGALIVK